MYWWTAVVLVLVMTVNCEHPNDKLDHCPNVKTNVRSIRKRRHLVFPYGSVAAITISLAKAFHTHAPSGWMMTSDLDVLYPLPDSKFTNSQFRKTLHHRQKRTLWERLTQTFYFKNMNGHECVLRSICEARKYLAPPGRSLIHDILRAIFTAPMHEPDFVEEIHQSYNQLLDTDVCERVHDCPLSILQFILDLNKQKI